MIHKKMQIRALLSRTAKDLSPVALVLWNWLMARTSGPDVRVGLLRAPTPAANDRLGVYYIVILVIHSAGK